MRVKLQIIANPKAGHGRGPGNISKLKSLLRLSGLKYEILETTAAGEATEIARDLAKRKQDRIIVLGGDGTISEVVNGILGTTVELGMICVGTCLYNTNNHPHEKHREKSYERKEGRR